MKKRRVNYLQNHHKRIQVQKSIEEKSLTPSQKREIDRRKKYAAKHVKEDKRIALEQKDELQRIAYEKELALRKITNNENLEHAKQINEMHQYYENLLKDSEESKKEAKKATRECILNLAGASLAMAVSLLSGGIVPGILMLVAGCLVMGGFFHKKLHVSKDVGAVKGGVIKAMLATSFLKRAEDITKAFLIIGGLTGALSSVALPFAVVTLVASALAFGLAARSYMKDPKKGDILSVVGTGLNLLGSAAVVGIAISALFVGAAVLSNPIGAVIVGVILVTAAVVKLKSALNSKREAKEKLKESVAEKEAFETENSHFKFNIRPQPDRLQTRLDSEHEPTADHRSLMSHEIHQKVCGFRYNKRKHKPVERSRTPIRWSKVDKHDVDIDEGKISSELHQHASGSINFHDTHPQSTSPSDKAKSKQGHRDGGKK